MDTIQITSNDEAIEVDIAEIFEIVVAEVEASYRERLLSLERINDRLLGELRVLCERAQDGKALPRDGD
jgi:hypothetical protein